MPLSQDIAMQTIIFITGFASRENDDGFWYSTCSSDVELWLLFFGNKELFRGDGIIELVLLVGGREYSRALRQNKL